MADFKMEIDGADELAACIEKALAFCPDDMNLAMKRAAKGFREDCNAKFPATYDKGKRPFKKNWKTENTYGAYGYITETTVANKSPHWHLVENGHQKWIDGKNTGGFVPGRHYAEKTRGEYEEKYPEMMQEAALEALEKAGL